MSTSGSIWYFALEDERVGPRTLEEMRELVGEGVILPETLVWTQGMAEWVPAASFPVLTSPAEAPGEEPPALPAGTPPAEEPPVVPPAAHAWSRWLARLLDLNLFFPVVLAANGVDLTNLRMTQVGELSPFLVPGTVLLWVPIEAVLLALLGTTAGKALFAIRVTSASGGRPPLGAALLRSIRVAVQGMGLGISFVMIATWALGYFRLTRSGAAAWDEGAGLRVRHSALGPVRTVLLSVLVMMTLLSLLVRGG
jgi:hypothetical protein